MVQDFRTIGLPALLSFHTVARLGGVSAAADHLGVAKSGVSRHVAQLKAHFGVRLLERGARSVRLTSIGARLDQRIRSILAEIDVLDDIVREESAGISGQVTIAATPEFGDFIVSKIFPEMQRRHPELRLVIRPAYAFEDMQDPNTDIAVRGGTFNDDRLVARDLGAFRCWLVAAPEVVNAHKIAHPEDLKDAPCLTFRDDRPETSWTLYALGTRSVVDVAGPIAVRSFDLLLQLAKDGRGYALLPEFMLAEAIASGALMRCLPGHVSRRLPVFLTYRSGARRIARVDAALALTEELLTELLPEAPPE